MSAGLKKESYYQHVSLLACYLISNLIVSCLNHFNNIISACFPKYTLFFLGWAASGIHTLSGANNVAA